MNLIKTILLCCNVFILIQLNGQALSWMDKNGLAKVGDPMGLGILGVVDQDIAVRAMGNMGILDANNLKLKKKYKYSLKSQTILHLDGKWYAFQQKAKLFKKNQPLKFYYTQLGAKSKKEKLLLNIESGASGKADWKAIKKETKKQNLMDLVRNPPGFTASKNGKWMMFPYFDFLNKKIRYIVFDSTLEKVYEKEIAYEQEIEGVQLNLLKAKSIIEDDGNISLMGYTGHSSNSTSSLYVLQWDQSKGELLSYVSASTKNVIFGEDKNLYVLTKKDKSDTHQQNVLIRSSNQQIIYAGLYKDENGGGVLIGRFDRDKKAFAKLTEVPFDQDLLNKIKTNEKGKLKSKIKGEVFLQDIVIKQNNEVSVFLEIDGTQKNTKFVARPRGGSLAPQTNTNTVYDQSTEIDLDCRDIIYFNFSPENELKYKGVIKKHQKKGSAKAASFICTTKDNVTYVLFNTLDKNKSSILSYAINNDGTEVTEKILLEPQKKLLIYPNRLDLFEGYRSIANQGIGTSVLATNKAGEIFVEGVYKKRATLVKVQY